MHFPRVYLGRVGRNTQRACVIHGGDFNMGLNEREKIALFILRRRIAVCIIFSRARSLALLRRELILFVAIINTLS